MFSFSWDVIVIFWVVILCRQGVPEDGGPLFHPHLRPNHVTTHNPHVLLPDAEITCAYMHHKEKGVFPDSLLLSVWLIKDGVPDIATTMRSTSKWEISCGVLCLKIWLLFVVYRDPWQICAYGPAFFVQKKKICTGWNTCVRLCVILTFGLGYTTCGAVNFTLLTASAVCAETLGEFNKQHVSSSGLNLIEDLKSHCMTSVKKSKTWWAFDKQQVRDIPL